MSQFSQEAVGGKHRRRPSLRRPLILVPVGLFMACAGLWCWNELTSSDPVRLIRHGSVSERRQATIDLQEVSDNTDVDRVLAVLVSAMEDKDVAVRSMAEDALAAVAAEILRRPTRTPVEQKWTEQRLAVTIQMLTRGLSDPEPTVRVEAACAFGVLAQTKKLDLPPQLIAALSDVSSSVRREAAKAFKGVQLTVDVVPALIKAYDRALKSERELIGQNEISAALGRIAPGSALAPSAVAILIRALDSNHDWVRYGAAQALGILVRMPPGPCLDYATLNKTLSHTSELPPPPLARRSKRHPYPTTRTQRTIAEASTRKSNHVRERIAHLSASCE
jgi:hypothetical protein